VRLDRKDLARLLDPGVYQARASSLVRGGRREFAKKSTRSSGWFIAWANREKTGTSSPPMTRPDRCSASTVLRDSDQRKIAATCDSEVCMYLQKVYDPAACMYRVRYAIATILRDRVVTGFLVSPILLKHITRPTNRPLGRRTNELSGRTEAIRSEVTGCNADSPS